MSRHGTYSSKYGFIPDDDCQEPQKLKSNGDRVRGMSDEELVTNFILGDAVLSCPPDESITALCLETKDCNECWLEWLKSPAEEDR